MKTYEYAAPNLRAQCLQVLSGNTCDLFLDLGFREFARHRVQLLRVGSGLRKAAQSTRSRLRAAEALEVLTGILKPVEVSQAVLLEHWPLRVVTHKNASDSHWGPWLVEIWTYDEDGVEFCVNDRLIDLGLASDTPTNE
jgi:hypothetical protein